MLWERSLQRSHRRRERARRARRNAPRQKGATLAAGAAILATPVLAPLASASSARPGVTKTEVAKKAAANQSLPTALLSYGDTGEAVVAVQMQLQIVSDGIFGPQTEGAVKRFQRSKGLAATGVVDARTWVELFRSNVLFYDEGSSSSSSSSVKVSYDGGEAQPAEPEPVGGPDLSDRVELRDEVEDSTPLPRSDAAPAPESTPVSTGSGGCTSDGRIVTPVSGGTVTGTYGEDRGDHVHTGTDIAVPTGTTVRAADCGTVSVSGTESGYGEMVCIRHAGGTTTCYAHLSERDVTVSEYAEAGQKIGEVGCTGSCTGPHVHFEVRQDGAATDPAPYLSGARTVEGEPATATSAALPEGEGGIGGPTQADEAAVFGSTGGVQAPESTGTTPTSDPAATTPTSDPAAAAPTSDPAATAPTSDPAATTPTSDPAATTPTSDPAGTAPASEPVATEPAAQPAPTTQPVAEAPAAEPAVQAPAPAAEPPAPAVEAPAAEAPAPAADASASAPAAAAAVSADAAATGGAVAPGS